MRKVEIQFGGKTRRLIYDFNALAEIQDCAATYRSEVPRLKAIRDTLWAGMLADTLDRRGRETPETLSLAEVGNILNGATAEDVESWANAVTEAMEQVKPKDPMMATAQP